MRGLLIPNETMPKSCSECPCFRIDECMAEPITFGDNGGWANYWANFTRPDWCPLIEIDLDDGLYQVHDDRIWKYKGKGKR